MQTLRTLRRSRDLTFLDLAQLTGIPVRLLAEAEYGLRALSGYECSQLAFVFGINESALGRATSVVRTPSNPLAQSLKQSLVAAAIVTTLVTSVLRARETVAQFGTAPAAPQAAIALALPSATPSATASATLTPSPTSSPTASPTASPTLTPSPSATALPTATPAFVWSDDGPLGCPLDTSAGQIVVTQGYGVGTHAPAATMGGIDLAFDTDGDGSADPASTFHAVVRATHAGVVRLDANTWPAGNHIWVTDQTRGWRTGYAHLDAFLVADGQQVEPGTPIGLVGLTGQTSGPHLHYHVWQGETNIDPTPLIGSCFSR